uniref:NHL repeat containing 4 n=1 Tax=Macrostomum lignano TaxID=282301 RepID=A0A1I8J8E5_9PLAT
VSLDGNGDPSDLSVSAGEDASYLARSAPCGVFGLGPSAEVGQLSAPRGIAACPRTGALFVADSNNHRLQAFSLTGQVRLAFGRRGAGPGEFECVTGVAVDPASRRVFATDRYNHKVLVFDYQGEFLRQFGAEGSGPGQFRYPWGAAVHSGHLYVADKKNHRVQVFDLDGQFLSSFGEHGRSDGQLDNPHFVCVRPDGASALVFVSDSNNNRVQVGSRIQIGAILICLHTY